MECICVLVCGKCRGKCYGSWEEKCIISFVFDNFVLFFLFILFSGIFFFVLFEEKECDKVSDEEDCSVGENGDEDFSLEVLSGGDEIGDFVFEEGVIWCGCGGE